MRKRYSVNTSDLSQYQSPCPTKDLKNTQFFLMEMNWKLSVCDHFTVDKAVYKTIYNGT